jgi:hypothetical protein
MDPFESVQNILAVTKNHDYYFVSPAIYDQTFRTGEIRIPFLPTVTVTNETMVQSDLIKINNQVGNMKLQSVAMACRHVQTLIRGATLPKSHRRPNNSCRNEPYVMVHKIGPIWTLETMNTKGVRNARYVLGQDSANPNNFMLFAFYDEKTNDESDPYMQLLNELSSRHCSLHPGKYNSFKIN